ncbi:MAG: hypothetical protein KKB29_03035 [Nanoarchaeota archaeon]|nr:hypothetical protein [Nanoarchaeota archaeon]
MAEYNLRFQPWFKLARHSQLVEYLEGEQIFPIEVEISPSRVCNAKCPVCFYGKEEERIRGPKYFEESRMEKLIEEFSVLGVKSIDWSGGGEPTLHPSFPQFAEWAKQNGIKQGLFTNALEPIQYDPSLFEWIRVTKTNRDLNEGSLETLRECKTLGICVNYRGDVDYENVGVALKIAETLESSKKNPSHSTYVQVRPALKIRGEKVDIVPPNIEHPLLQPTHYKFSDSSLSRTYNDCRGYHFIPWIWQDGDVDVCSHHRKKPEFNLGNLYREGKGGGFKHIMENVPRSVPVADDCQVCCKPHEINSLIHIMENLQDVDFP